VELIQAIQEAALIVPLQLRKHVRMCLFSIVAKIIDLMDLVNATIVH